MQQVCIYIEAVAREGSFSKAAESLGITQPALSIAIGKEEERLGIPLFERETHPIMPTEAGSAYLHAIQGIRKEEEELEKRIGDIKHLEEGSVRIGGSHYLNSYILAPMLSAFARQYPKIRLSLEEAGSDVLSQMLKDHALEVTFSCNTSFMADFERYPLFCDHLLLAVPQEDPFNEAHASFILTSEQIQKGAHLDSACPQIPSSALSQLSYVLLKPGNNLYDRAMMVLRESETDPDVRLLVSQMATAYRLAQAGFASAIISDRLVTGPVPLSFYKIDPRVAERRFYMLVASRDYTSHALSAFIHFATKWFKDC